MRVPFIKADATAFMAADMMLGEGVGGLLSLHDRGTTPGEGVLRSPCRRTCDQESLSGEGIARLGVRYQGIYTAISLLTRPILDYIACRADELHPGHNIILLRGSIQVFDHPVSNQIHH